MFFLEGMLPRQHRSNNTGRDRHVRAPARGSVFHFKEDNIIYAEQNVALILAKKDVQGIPSGIQQMRGNSAGEMVEAAAGITVGTDDVTGFKDQNAIAAGYINRAIEIDVVEQAVESDFDQNACIDGDCDISFWRNDADVRNTDVFIARSGRRILPFFGARAGLRAQ